jgi:hypothetical protein
MDVVPGDRLPLELLDGLQGSASWHEVHTFAREGRRLHIPRRFGRRYAGAVR